jgi:hypothetical protein
MCFGSKLQQQVEARFKVRLALQCVEQNCTMLALQLCCKQVCCICN